MTTIYPKAITKLGILSIAAIGLQVGLATAQPYEGRGKGTVAAPNNVSISSTRSWAKGGANQVMPIMVVSLVGQQWTHTYAQADCPQGYTLKNPAPTISEIKWSLAPNAISKVQKMQGNQPVFSAGNFAGRVNLNPQVEEKLSSHVKILGAAFQGANMDYVLRYTTRDVYLNNDKNVTSAQNGEGPFPDSDSAAGGEAVIPGTAMPKWVEGIIVICTKNAGGMQCGDFICEEGEAQTCPVDCNAWCGDGLINGTEQCDDGNFFPGDGCDVSCMIESCNQPSCETCESAPPCEESFEETEL